MIIINNRDKILWEKDMTIENLFTKMGYDYALITVTVNDIFIDENEYSTYKLSDNDNVNVFHLAHGG